MVDRIQDPRLTKTVFAFSPADATSDGLPVMTFLIPEKAYDQMRSGLSTDFDMTKIGLPVKIVIGRCKTYQSGLQMLRDVAAARGIEVKDVTSVDMAIEDSSDKKRSN